MSSVRPSPLVKTKQISSENNVHYWLDCGSGQVDHWWQLSCWFCFYLPQKDSGFDIWTRVGKTTFNQRPCNEEIDCTHKIRPHPPEISIMRHRGKNFVNNDIFCALNFMNVYKASNMEISNFNFSVQSIFSVVADLMNPEHSANFPISKMKCNLVSFSFLCNKITFRDWIQAGWWSTRLLKNCQVTNKTLFWEPQGLETNLFQSQINQKISYSVCHRGK